MHEPATTTPQTQRYDRGDSQSLTCSSFFPRSAPLPE